MDQQKKYYTVEEAAGILGITPAEVNQRRERNELRGFRDGASWKFKVEDIEAIVREKRFAKDAPADESADVLLSDLELGGSEASTTGTVIGPATGAKSPSDSDIQLADDDTGVMAKPAAPAEKSGAADLELTLEEDGLGEPALKLEDDTGTVAGMPSKPAAPPVDDSSIALMDDGRKLDDDDIVLGGASSGSDITIGGDSGISLVDPTDSGLSLEEPLELDRIDDDSLELGEDDMLAFADDTGGSEAPAAIKKDEEFLLTPLEEASDEEDSESGSQVIALDAPAVNDTTSTMIAPAGPMPSAGLGALPDAGLAPLGAAGGMGMAAMLDEDFATGGAAGLAAAGAASPFAGGALGAASPVFAAGSPLGGPAMMAAGGAPVVAITPPEAPYTGLNITALVFTLLLVLLCGWVSYDLVRNMWSWSGEYTVNSKFMELILGLFG